MIETLMHGASGMTRSDGSKKAEGEAATEATESLWPTWPHTRLQNFTTLR
jgi:hypothetical protein